MTSAVSPRISFQGELGSGKTELVTALIGEPFVSSRRLTVCRHSIPTMKITEGVDAPVDVYLFDTEGEERFGILSPIHYRVPLIVFVFDLTDMNSFRRLQQYWFGQAESRDHFSTITCIVVGTKLDIAAEGSTPEGGRQVTSEEASSWASSKAMRYVEVSSKSGEGIQDRLLPMMTRVLSGRDYVGDQPAACGRGVRLPAALPAQPNERSCMT